MPSTLRLTAPRLLSTLITQVHTCPHTNHIILREYLSSIPNTVVVTDITDEIATLNKRITDYWSHHKPTYKMRTQLLVARYRLRNLYSLLSKKHDCKLTDDGRLLPSNHQSAFPLRQPRPVITKQAITHSQPLATRNTYQPQPTKTKREIINDMWPHWLREEW